MYTLLQLSFILIRFFLLLIFFFISSLVVVGLLLRSFVFARTRYFIFIFLIWIFKFSNLLFSGENKKKTMHTSERARAREETGTVSSIHKKNVLCAHFWMEMVPDRRYISERMKKRGTTTMAMSEEEEDA